MLMHHYMIELTSGRFLTMDATDYWLFAHEYSTWNATVSALQFWTADLDPQTLSSVIEKVYTAIFYSDSAQHLQYIKEEILFSHYIPGWMITHLRMTNLPPTQHSTRRGWWHRRTPPTISLEDVIWIEEPVPERYLHIHENSQHDLCPYPCPYSLNLLHLAQEEAPQYIELSDIFKFPDVVVSASDDDVPSLEDILGLKEDSVNIFQNYFSQWWNIETSRWPVICCSDQDHVYR